jgi:hypothetical protein
LYTGFSPARSSLGALAMVRLLYRRSSADAGVFAASDRENSTFGPRYGGMTT